MNGDFEHLFFFSLSLFLFPFPQTVVSQVHCNKEIEPCFRQSFLGNFERVGVEGGKWIILESDLRSLVAEQRINER